MMGFVDNETLRIRGLSKYLKAQFVVGQQMLDFSNSM
jgi:hypothetical protein